jgi:WD40 repeat protein
MTSQTPATSTEGLSDHPEGFSEGPKHITFPAFDVSVVTCLLLRPGRIISASDNHSILVHSVTSGELLQSLQGHEGSVWSLAVFGDTLASGSTDRTVRIWDLTIGRCTHVFEGHTSTIRCLNVVEPEWLELDGKQQRWPDHPLIVTGSRDHSLRVWTLPLVCFAQRPTLLSLILTIPYRRLLPRTQIPKFGAMSTSIPFIAVFLTGMRTLCGASMLMVVRLSLEAMIVRSESGTLAVVNVTGR